MLTKTILAAGALFSMATAVPMAQMNKRDVKWETSTHWDVTTIDVTTTIWLGPGETAPADSSPTDTAPAHFGHHHHKPKVTSHIKSTVTVQPVGSSAPPAPPASSPYVAPSPSSPAAPDTTTYAPPPQSPSPSPSPSPTTPTGGSGTGPSGSTYTGDITHYDVGLGSCGYTNNDSEAVVAIPFGMMNNGANPNANPLCGKTITISYQGQEHTAKIVDTCGGCYDAAIDLSPTLFSAVAPNGDGRVHGVEWWYN